MVYNLLIMIFEVMSMNDDFYFYNVDEEYIDRLRQIDTRVQNYYENKPYLGIIRLNDRYNYFIPISSPKDKNIDMDEEGDFYFLLYEYIAIKELTYKNIVRQYTGNMAQKLLGTLSVNNMIPVPEKYYSRIHDFRNRRIKYNDLLYKEYQFCMGIKEK